MAVPVRKLFFEAQNVLMTALKVCKQTTFTLAGETSGKIYALRQMAGTPNDLLKATSRSFYLIPLCGTRLSARIVCPGQER
jgi:hypothetical protein